MAETQYIEYSWVVDILQRAARFFDRSGQPAYLVGGSVRNMLLGVACTDWDVVVEGEVKQVARLGRELANELGGFYAHLHEKASRVIVKQGDEEFVLDVSPQLGGSIEADLGLRDFTVNAVAVPLAVAVEGVVVGGSFQYIDPLGGVEDARKRVLRVASQQALVDDPLRIMRALRLQMRYGLMLEEETEKQIREHATLLQPKGRVAAERIHEELYMILQPAQAITRLREMDRLGLLTTLVPELEAARGMRQPGLHNWDVFDHSLETVATLEELVEALQQKPEELRRSRLNTGEQGDLQELQILLQEAEGQGLFQMASMSTPQMKLAALLHDIGKPVTHQVDEKGQISFYHHPQAGVPIVQAIMQRLSASVADRRLVQQVTAHHMRPGQLSQDVLTLRATRRYFVDLGPTGIVVALVALADHLSMRGPKPLTEHWTKHVATVRALLTQYIRQRERILPPRLLTADDLMRKLGITPGPLIGKLLDAISEAQTEGQISSKEEALWFAEEKLQELQAER